MIRRPVLFWCLLALVASALNYYISDRARLMQGTLEALHDDIAKAEELQRVQQAEWAYLAAPQRLQRLAKQQLGLARAEQTQVISLASLNASLPMVDDRARQTAASAWQNSLMPARVAMVDRATPADPSPMAE